MAIRHGFDSFTVGGLSEFAVDNTHRYVFYVHISPPFPNLSWTITK